MSVLRYWTGTGWAIVPTGTGGGGGGLQGPPGPQGPAGESVEVYGPQPDQPVPNRKGDLWLATQSVAVVQRLPDDPEPPVIESLSDEPDPLVIYIN